jgi:hypothetical protein
MSKGLFGDEQGRHVAVVGGAVLHEHPFGEPDEAAGAERPLVGLEGAFEDVHDLTP